MITTMARSGREPHIVFANTAFTAMTGYELTELLRQSPRLLHGQDTDAAAIAHFLEQLRHDHTARIVATYYRRSGESLRCEIFASRLIVGAKRHPYFVAFQREIMPS